MLFTYSPRPEYRSPDDKASVLRHILEKYPAIQSHDLVAAAGLLIKTVKALNKPRDNEIDDIHLQDPKVRIYIYSEPPYPPRWGE